MYMKERENNEILPEMWEKDINVINNEAKNDLFVYYYLDICIRH